MTNSIWIKTIKNRNRKSFLNSIHPLKSLWCGKLFYRPGSRWFLLLASSVTRVASLVKSLVFPTFSRAFLLQDNSFCPLQSNSPSPMQKIKVASNTTAGYVIMYIQNDVMIFKRCHLVLISIKLLKVPENYVPPPK